MLKRSQSSHSLFVVEVKVDVVVQRPAVDVGSRLKVLLLKARRCTGRQNQHQESQQPIAQITLDHPWHPGRGNPKKEGREKSRKKKVEDRRKESTGRRKGEGGKGKGRNMRESVRPVQRWYAHSYRAGDHKRCSNRRIHRL